MTSRERIEAAMSGRTPDRVPVMCQMSIGHMLVQLGCSPADFWYDAETFARGLCSLREQYGFDGILVSLHGHDPDWRNGIRERGFRDGREVIEWKDGSSTRFPPDDLPEHTPVSVGDAHAPDEDVPAVIDSLPVSQGLHFRIHPDHAFDIFPLVRSLAGPDISVHGEVTSALDYYLDWLGLEQGLMLMIDDPARAKVLLSGFAAGIAGLAGRMCRHDIDAVKISSPFAGAGFLSREQYEEFVLPAERMVAGAVRKQEKHAYIHTCGAIGDRLDLMQRTGADGLECLDPPPMGSVELARALEELQGEVFVKGNVDSVHSLLNGSPASIREDAMGRLAVGKAYKRYILSTACSIAPHVPSDHVRILTDVVREHGTFEGQ